MSLRSVRSSCVFSTWPVCLRRRSWRSCSRISRSLVEISAGARSRISLEVMTGRFKLSSRTVAYDETAMKRQLGIGETECLFGDRGGDTSEFKENGARLDYGYVVFDRTFTLTHAGFSSLLCDR